MATENRVIGLKDLSKKYSRTLGYFRTILCRPEFNKFVAPTPFGQQRSMFWFYNSDEFKKSLNNIIYLKNTAKGRSCRGIY